MSQKTETMTNLGNAATQNIPITSFFDREDLKRIAVASKEYERNALRCKSNCNCYAERGHKTINRKIKNCPDCEIICDFITENDLRQIIRSGTWNSQENIERYGHISKWKTDLITDMHELFKHIEYFTEDISRWNTGNVKNMESMFQYAFGFNSDISRWNTSQVENMRKMFYATQGFNRNLSGWNTGNVKDMSEMFHYNHSFNGDISGWNTSQVKNMRNMFRMATSFNGDISSWDTGNVKDMSSMFDEAINFRGDLSSWDTRNVLTMEDMFKRTKATFENTGIRRRHGGSTIRTYLQKLGMYLDKSKIVT